MHIIYYTILIKSLSFKIVFEKFVNLLLFKDLFF